MTVVVDLGCAPQGEDESIQQLTKRFRPRAYYGFDPADKEWIAEAALYLRKAHVRTYRLGAEAAWLWDGQVGFNQDAILGHVNPGSEQKVVCFDFAIWLKRQPKPVILKMDIEGGEYALLQRIISTRANNKISRLLVEWHFPDRDPNARLSIENRLQCPIEEWY